MDFDFITEAMERNATPTQALERLAEQVRNQQTHGVIDMYATAARCSGASYDEVEATIAQARAA